MICQRLTETHLSLRRKYFVIVFISLLLPMLFISLQWTNQRRPSDICVLCSSTSKSDSAAPVIVDVPIPQWDWTRDLDCLRCTYFVNEVVDEGVGCGGPILTMFSSMHDADTMRDQIHNNTLVNWSLLGPCVQRIMFVANTSSVMAQVALENQWMVRKIPRTLHDIPVLKSMFLAAFNTTSTPLYLYANADILFDFSLVKTSCALLCALLSRHKSQQSSVVSSSSSADPLASEPFKYGLFAVGRRTNVNETDISSVNPRDVTSLKVGRQLFESYAEDYFLCSSSHGLGLDQSTVAPFKTRDGYSKANNTTKSDRLTDSEDPNIWGRSPHHSNSLPQSDSHPPSDSPHQIDSSTSSDRNCSDVSTCVKDKHSRSKDRLQESGYFPWEEIPDFVVGRIAYDNWLVAQAVKWNITWSIDVTNTVHAIHQTGPHGIRSGLEDPDHLRTIYLNHDLTDVDYFFGAGRTNCLPWLTFVGLDRCIAFVEREHIHDECIKPKNYSNVALRKKKAKYRAAMLPKEGRKTITTKAYLKKEMKKLKRRKFSALANNRVRHII